MKRNEGTQIMTDTKSLNNTAIRAGNALKLQNIPPT